jgi:cell wall-associated NlpC family hydrolase
MSRVQKAIDFALAIAKDDTHGYDQAKRDGKPDYDCSALVIASFEAAGIRVKDAGATFTGNMRQAFLKCGFKDVASLVNLTTGAGMIPGDVLLHENHHTAIYIGNKEIVHASINELGRIIGGKPGDQTGKEICVRSYYNHPWNSVLRYSEVSLTFEMALEIVSRKSGISMQYWLERRHIDPNFEGLITKIATVMKGEVK